VVARCRRRVRLYADALEHPNDGTY